MYITNTHTHIYILNGLAKWFSSLSYFLMRFLGLFRRHRAPAHITAAGWESRFAQPSASVWRWVSDCVAFLQARPWTPLLPIPNHWLTLFVVHMDTLQNDQPTGYSSPTKTWLKQSPHLRVIQLEKAGYLCREHHLKLYTHDPAKPPDLRALLEHAHESSEVAVRGCTDFH